MIKRIQIKIYIRKIENLRVGEHKRKCSKTRPDIREEILRNTYRNSKNIRRARNMIESEKIKNERVKTGKSPI